MSGRKTSQVPVDDLQELRDQLRAEIREARGMLKDLRYEIRQARELAPKLVREAFEAEAAAYIDELGKVTMRQMDRSTAKVIAEFDRLADTLMGRTPAARSRGDVLLPDLVRVVALRDVNENEGDTDDAG